MLEKTVHLGLLMDFYGPLLTEKQRLYFALYHQEDMSLGEIGAAYGVTRQAVYDILRRSQNSLLEAEARLGLARRYAGQKAELQGILDRMVLLLTTRGWEIQGAARVELTSIEQSLKQMIADL